MKAFARILLGVLMAAATPAFAQLQLHLPVDCIPGEDCFIQNYMDHDAESGEKAAHDYTCKHMTYDGHNGTDFRVPTYADLQRNINVLAAEDGTIKAVQVEQDINPEDIPLLKLIKFGMQRPCGSMIQIDHGTGWESYYCHLDPTGNQVKVGDEVKAGQVIGRMGRSGESIFPHLHYELRHYGTAVDPFVGYANTFECGESRLYSQWSPDAQELLAYDPTGVVKGAFSAQTPDSAQTREGGQDEELLAASLPELHFWVELFGLRRYDRLELSLSAPDGTLLAQKRIDYDEPFALAFESISAKRGAQQWPQGTYVARAKLKRYERIWPQVLVERRWLVDVE